MHLCRNSSMALTGQKYIVHREDYSRAHSVKPVREQACEAKSSGIVSEGPREYQSDGAEEEKEKDTTHTVMTLDVLSQS